ARIARTLIVVVRFCKLALWRGARAFAITITAITKTENRFATHPPTGTKLHKEELKTTATSGVGPQRNTKKKEKTKKDKKKGAKAVADINVKAAGVGLQGAEFTIGQRAEQRKEAAGQPDCQC